MFRLGMQPADKTSFKQLISSLINTMAEPSCVYNVPTTVGEIQFFDFGLNRTEAQKHCEDRSSILAPIKTKKVLDEILDYFQPCLHENKTLLDRTDQESFYNVGLRSVNGIGTWSDGTLFNASLHDSVEPFQRPGKYLPGSTIEDSKDDSNETCRFYHYSKKYNKSLIWDGCHLWEHETFPFLCMGPSSPSSLSGPSDSSDSSSSVIIIVLILLLVPLIVSLGICYIKRDWIKSKVEGVSTEEE